MPPTIGMRFGRYELLDKIGAGGMGEVYRAQDLDLGRDVAVKFLPEQLRRDPRPPRPLRPGSPRGLLAEPPQHRHHPRDRRDGGPALHASWSSSKGRRCASSCGRSTRSRRARCSTSACQLAEGLARAHAAGIVHRDLKPENVMLTRDGYVKILDFGLAKLRGDGSGAARPPARPISQMPTWPDAPGSPHTAAGVVMGTVGYMSPEQARGRPVDHRSDQFALGAMLYEMVSGRQPFQRESPVQTLAAIIEDEPEPLAARNPAFPAPARWIVERCLAKEPGRALRVDAGPRA